MSMLIVNEVIYLCVIDKPLVGTIEYQYLHRIGATKRMPFPRRGTADFKTIGPPQLCLFMSDQASISDVSPIV